MDPASVYLLGVTVLLCAVFGIIVARTYSPKRKERGERAKYRMMNDEGERKPKEDGDER